jgi:hypothetical protein
MGVVDKLFVTFPEAHQEESATEKFQLLWRQDAANLMPGGPSAESDWVLLFERGVGIRGIEEGGGGGNIGRILWVASAAALG